MVGVGSDLHISADTEPLKASVQGSDVVTSLHGREVNALEESNKRQEVRAEAVMKV